MLAPLSEGGTKSTARRSHLASRPARSMTGRLRARYRLAANNCAQAASRRWMVAVQREASAPVHASRFE